MLQFSIKCLRITIISCIIIHDNDRLGALVEVFSAVLVPNPTGLQREETGDDGQDNDGDFDDFVGFRTLQRKKKHGKYRT